MKNAFVRFVNRPACQSFGYVACPAEAPAVTVDFTDLFVVPTKGRPRKAVAPATETYDRSEAVASQSDRIRPIDYLCEKLVKPIYIEEESGDVVPHYYTCPKTGKQIRSKRTAPANYWGVNDDTMVNNIVDAITMGDNITPSGGIPLFELFKSAISEMDILPPLSRGKLMGTANRELPE